jgi:phosphoribosylcarboxyaminoimidazole (NCAIR) mutase
VIEPPLGDPVIAVESETALLAAPSLFSSFIQTPSLVLASSSITQARVARASLSAFAFLRVLLRAHLLFFNIASSRLSLRI